MPKQQFFVNEDELDDFQVQLLQKRIDRSMVVSGCAGSGKSILALWKAKQIQDLSDGSSYKFIVFTKALNQYMSDGIRNVGLENQSFTHYYQWKKNGKPSADFIIVDEIQDFDRKEIAEFKKAARRAFFFWGDSAQSIYSGLKDSQNILSIASDASVEPEKLHFNHRLPKKIARFAALIIGDDELVSRCRKEGTEAPKILQFRSLEEQLDAAMEQISNRQIDDAAIMFPSNELVQHAYGYLRSQGHHIEAKYEDKKDYHSSKMDLEFDSDNPKMMTYHSAKGLQFEAVFLPECNVNESFYKAPLYVALTRSYRYLFVMYSTTLSRFFGSVTSDLYDTSLEDDEIHF